MSFLLRASILIAVIFVHSPVHDEEWRWTNHGGESLARLIDEGAYENWSALPPHARDRLTMEIARQLADAAAGR